jgi:hypothetical protein
LPPSSGGICAIHQPNLFPRLSTLAKLFAADTWIVLDNVQFNRRDYQHRTRLANLTDPSRHQWLTIAAHLPDGRDTLIHHVRTADPARSKRRLEALTERYYGDSPHWPDIAPALQTVARLFDTTRTVATIAEASTTALLRSLGWTGTIVRSSALNPCDGRSERLADLAHRINAHTYLCGTGGMRYLNHAHFHAHDINVAPFQTPQDGIWELARAVTALWQLATAGRAAVHTELRRQTTAQ